MSILSDRRSLREIGGLRAYVRQVGWSLWWRTQPGSSPPSRSSKTRLDHAAQPHGRAVPAHLPATRARVDHRAS